MANSFAGALQELAGHSIKAHTLPAKERLTHLQAVRRPSSWPHANNLRLLRRPGSKHPVQCSGQIQVLLLRAARSRRTS